MPKRTHHSVPRRLSAGLACALLTLGLAAAPASAPCAEASAPAVQSPAELAETLKKNTLARTTEYYMHKYGVPADKAAVIEAHMKALAGHPGFIEAVVARDRMVEQARQSGIDPDDAEDLKGELYQKGLMRAGVEDLSLCVETNIRLAGIMTPEQYKAYQLQGLAPKDAQGAPVDADALLYRKFDTPSLKAWLEHRTRMITAGLDGGEARKLTPEDARAAGAALQQSFQKKFDALSAADKKRLGYAFANLPTAPAADVRDVLVLLHTAMLEVPAPELENVLRFFFTDADSAEQGAE
ncbi:MAG: hypothetical protein Q4F72_02860 [Desulfovibrionaceae bacterium]|nr:hypothetical protein [Desulfovibrionaceae bacterium]